MKTPSRLLKEAIDIPDEEYRGCRIHQNSKSVDRKNKISGHEWTERVNTKGFTVSGCFGIGVTRVFGSPKSAKETIDFYLKYPPPNPRSEREITKAKKLKLI